MAFPFLNNNRPSKTQMQRAGHRPIRALPSAPSRPMRKMLFEPLEPRVLLDGEGALVVFKDAISEGFDALYQELLELRGSENDQTNPFNALVPGFLTTLVDPDTGELIVTSPTLAQALSIDVDVYAFGVFETALDESVSLQDRFKIILEEIVPELDDLFSDFPTSDAAAEMALSVMDIDGDGRVGAAEAFGVLVFGQIAYWADGLDLDADADLDDFVEALDDVIYFNFLEVFGGLGANELEFLSPFLTTSFDFVNFSVDIVNGSLVIDTAISLTLHQDDIPDLGFEADEMGIVLDPGPANPQAAMNYQSFTVDIERKIEFDQLIFGISDFVAIWSGDLTPDASDQFYFSAPEGVSISLLMDHAGVDGLIVNVGFLGTQAGDGSFFHLDMAIEGAAEDPSDPTPLGFDGSPTVAPGQVGDFHYSSIHATAAPHSGELANATQFRLTFGEQDYGPARTVTIPAGTDLDADFIGAIEAALDAADIDDLVPEVRLESGRLYLELVHTNAAAMGFEEQAYAPPGVALIAAGVPDFTIFDVDGLKFLLSIGGGLPKLISVPANAAIDSVAALRQAIQDEVDTHYSGVTVSVNSGKIQFFSGDRSIEITRTMGFDRAVQISIAEMDAHAVFDGVADPASEFEAVLNLKALANLHYPDLGQAAPYDGSAYRPEGTIATTPDGINAGAIELFGDTVTSKVIDRIPGTDIEVTRATFQLLTDIGDMPEMLDFTVVSVPEMLSVINQLAIWFERLSANPVLLAHDIPFADAALSDLLAFGDMIRDTLLIDDRDDGLEGGTNDLARLVRWVEVADDQYELMPWFHNVQNFVDRLADIISLSKSDIAATYNPDNQELSFRIAVNHDLVPEPLQADGIEVPMIFPAHSDPLVSLLDPLGSLYTEGVLSLTAEGNFEFTLGIQLGENVQPLDLDETTLDQLNDDRGVEVNTNLALTSLQGLDPIVGRLSSNASFVVTLWTDEGVVQKTVRVLWSKSPEFASFLFPFFLNNAEWDDTSTRDNTVLADLVTDINKALEIAELDTLLMAVAVDDNQYAGSGEHDTGRVVLVAKSDTVQAFQVWSDSGNSASRELGLVSQSAATVSLVAPMLNEQVKTNDDLEFDLVIYREGGDPGNPEVVSVTVTEEAMADNRFFSDLLVDINRALAEAFPHEGDVLRNPDIVASRSGGYIVLSAVSAGIESFYVSDPNNPAKDILGFDGTEWVEQLKALGVEADGVQELVAGVTLRGKDMPMDPFGRIATDFKFEINGEEVIVDASATQHHASLDDLVVYLNKAINASDAKALVVVERDGQHLRFRALDPEIGELVYKHIDGEAGQIGFGDDEDGYKSGAELKIVANRDAPVSYGVKGGVGYLDSMPAEFTVTLYLEGEQDPLTWQVTLRDSETIRARSLYDLASRINHAMGAGFAEVADLHGLDPGDNPLIAIADGDRIVIGLKTPQGASKMAAELQGNAGLVDQSPGKGFSISADPTSKTATDLFLVPGDTGEQAADDADFLIVFSDGHIARISLNVDGLVEDFKLSAGKTLQDLIDAIVQQTGTGDNQLPGEYRLTMQLRGDGAGFELIDQTFDKNNPANNEERFEVVAINGSPAAQGLGIFASDITRLEVSKYDAGSVGVADGIIQGARIATVDIIQRVFIDDAILNAGITVKASANQEDGGGTLWAVGNYGFVGIKLSINTGEELYQGEFSYLDGADRLYLDEMLRLVGSASELTGYINHLPMLEVVADHDSFEMDVSIEPGFPASMDNLIDLSGLTPKITFAFGGANLGSLAEAVVYGRPTVILGIPAAIDVSDSGLGDLKKFADLGFGDVLEALRGIADFLDSFQDLEFLTDALPLIGGSIGELLNIADRFRAALQGLELNPAGGLQALDQALRQGIGIPEFGDLSVPANQAALQAYLENRGIPLPDDAVELAQVLSTQLIGFSLDVDEDELRFDLRLPLGFSQARAVDLDLSDYIDILGLDTVALQGGAGLNLKGFLDTRLAFGIDLNTQQMQIHKDETSIEGGLRAGATNLNFNAGIGPLGVFIRDGMARVELDFGLKDEGAGFSPYFEGDIEATLPVFFPDDSTYIDDLIFKLEDISLNGNNLHLPDPVVEFDFDFFSTIDFDSLNPFSSIPLMLDALDFFLMAMQDLLDGNVFGIDLPLIGDQLKGGSDFIDQLRRDVLGPIRDFTERAPELGAELIEKLLDGLLGDGISFDDALSSGENIFALLGINPAIGTIPGLGLLKEAVTPGGNAAENVYEWRFVLGDDYKPAVDFGFNLGFPALGLDLDGGLEVNIDWRLSLGLGISPTHGAYLLVGGHDGGDTEFEFDVVVKLPGSANGRLGFLQVLIENENVYTDDVPGDLSASFAVDLFSGSDTGSDILPFFDLGNLDAKISIDTQALLALGLTVQFNTAILPDPVGALLPKMKADFILDWGFETDDFFGGDFDLANSLKFIGFKDVGLDLGSFLGDFLGPFVGKIAEITEPFAPVLEAVTTPIPVISHLAGRPITLVDLAKIFGEVDLSMVYAIADIVALVQQIAGAGGSNELIIPLGDFTLYSENPGGIVTAANLANPAFRLGGSSASGTSDFDFLNWADDWLNDAVSDGFSLLDQIDLNGGGSQAAQINKSLVQGSAPGSSSFEFPLFENPFRALGLLIGQDITLVTYDLAPFHLSMTYVQQFPIWGPLFARLGGSIGLTIDLAFGYDTYGVRQFVESGGTNPLLLAAGFHVLGTDQPDGQGSPVDHLLLMGEIFAGAEINLGVASAGVEGGIRLEIGFRLHDNDGDGKIRMLEIATNFLHELRTNGPVLAPIAIFDVYGEISAFLRAFIEIFFFEASFEITPPIVIVEFQYEFDRPPVLATERGDGSLLLNIGPNSEARLNGNTADFGEEIYVRSISSTQVEVWSPAMGVPSGAAQVYTIGANKTIFVNGGKGNDTINLSELGHGIRYFVDAGPGDDTVHGGQSGGEMHGGLGDDKLYGGSGNDLIIGGAGNDYIEGGDGDDWIFGDNGSVTKIEVVGQPYWRFQSLVTPEDGDDTILGGNGYDVIFAGGGYDLVFGGGDDDLIIGDGGYFQGPERLENGVPLPFNGVPLVSKDVILSNLRVSHPELSEAMLDAMADSMRFVDVSQISVGLQGAADRIYGGAGNDTILGGPGDDFLDGGLDDDVILGGTGNDVIYGGPGGDWLFGDQGDDIIFGYRDPYDDADFALHPGELYGLLDADINGDGGDYIEGGDGNDFIRGQGGDDTIHGNRGADIMFGDTGKDTLGAGYLQRPWIQADKQAYDSEAGSDIIFGGADDDTIDGGAGGDIIFGDDGLVAYLFYAPAYSTDGFRTHLQTGSLIRTDASGEHKLIGDGNESLLIKANGDLDRADDKPTTPDLYAAQPHPDGTDGNDWIGGGDGNDIIFGGGGDDTIFGDFDPGQSFFGPRPTGNDVIIGDGGRVELYSRRFQAIEAIANALDGNDTLHGNDGNDIAFGGSGQDLIYGFHDPALVDVVANPELLESVDEVTDNDILFGDNGRIEFNPEERANRITRMFTTPEPVLPAPNLPPDAGIYGGNDRTYGQQGNDVIFGGLNNDPGLLPADVRFDDEYLGGGDGDDIIIGDQGEILFYALGFLGEDWERFAWDDFGQFELAPGEEPVFPGHALWTSSYPLLLIRSWADNQGGRDIIAGEAGADILIGGTTGDEMYGDDPGGSHGTVDGDDIMLGDNGEVWFNIDFAEPETDEDDQPIGPPNVSDGRLLGQVGAMLYPQSVDLIRTTDEVETTGGADVMSGNAGADVIFGGVNNGGIDYLYGDRGMPTRGSLEIDGDDVLIGDNGLVSFTYGPEMGWFTALYADPLNHPFLTVRVDIPFEDYDRAVLNLIVSFQDGFGGTDIISGNAGGDVAIGSTGDDIIYGDRAYDWASLVFGSGYAAQANDPLGMDLDGDDMLIGDNAYLLLTAWMGELPDVGERFGDLRLVLESAVFVIRSTDETDPANTGGIDTIAGNRGNDIIMGGVYGDFLYGDAVLLEFNNDTPEDGIDTRQAVRSGFDGDDIILGDNGALEWLSQGRLHEVEGNQKQHIDIAYENPWLAEWAEFNGQAEDWDLDLTTLDMITTEQPYSGGRDWIWGGDGNDAMFGGTDSDTMFGDNGLEDPFAGGILGYLDNPGATINGQAVTDEGNDLMFGDHGRLYPQFSWLRIYDDAVPGNEPGPWQGYQHSRNFFAIGVGDHETLDKKGGEGDRMWGQGRDDIMLGQQGDDRMWGGDGDDDMIGGHNVRGGWDELGTHGLIQAGTAVLDDDGIPTGEYKPFNDIMDGGAGDDVMAGDNAIVWRRPDAFDPRFRALEGTRIYTTDHDSITVHVEDIEANHLEFADPDARRLSPTGTPGRDVTLVDHDFDIEASDLDAGGEPTGRFGRDILAGGAEDDRMFGQLGDDLMQGDGDISLGDVKYPFTAWHLQATGLVPDDYASLWFNIPELETDGDDYMEGNGGADLMFGGLGQDDMIGGSSSLHGLDAWHKRPDGSDIMFGGAGIRTDRNDWGEAYAPGMASFAIGWNENAQSWLQNGGHLISIEMQTSGHARDADYMMGDNANIYRLVGVKVGGSEFIANPELYSQVVWNAGSQSAPLNAIRASFGLLAFNYDVLDPARQNGDERIKARAMEQLDYHLGGADYHGGIYVGGAAEVDGQPRDNGAPDFMHGEAGDDIMFGMTGSDLMFGGAGDDDMIGGYGHDWMSGGTGQDGMLGDDGLIFTSRNSAAYGEPLHGIDALLDKDPRPKYSDGNVLNEIIYTPGNIQYTMINKAGELKKSVDITPFSFDPDWEGMDDEYPDNADDTPFADDILFGGLGSDWLHGGSGDDAMSGAEALTAAFITVFDGDGLPVDILDLGYHAVGLPDGPWMFLGISTYGTQNPGNVLAFNPVDVEAWKTQNRLRAGEFYYYDEYDPLRRIMLTDTGELHKGEPGQGTANEFLLNFDPTEGVLREGGWTPGNKNQSVWYDPVNDDGADNLFGGNGNDWLVGGTGRDHLYGGWGNDLLNVDDDHRTNGALNDQPDTHPTYEDIAYGGAGRDVLIANTGGDRLIDWVGEYNSYLVPFAPFGMATVSRTLQPFLPEYLYALSMGDGIDLTRADDATDDGLYFDPVRNGEPFGELGLVLQKDFAWQAQTGAPADPQAGNIPGGKRDVLRTAYADGLNMTGFMIDSGNWTVAKGKFQVEPLKIGGDALAVWHHDQYTPNYFEVTATVNVVKPIAGFKANAYIIFDYQDADNFKFAGLNGSTNKLEIGQKTANGWVALTSINLQVRHSTDYNMLLSVNGTSVILQVNNQHQVSYTFAPRVDTDGIVYNINSGMIGLGADNAKAGIGNVRLQVLPPQITHSATDDFSGLPALVSPLLGEWMPDDGRMVAQPAGGAQFALAAGGLKVGPAYVLQLETTVSTGATGGIIFDQYATDDFKWAAWSKATNQVQIGHFTAKGGWVVDKTVTMQLKGDVELSVTLKGTTVSVLVNDSPAVSHVYNAVVTDGHFGLFSLGGSASFDYFTVMTDDPSFAAPESSDLTAAFAGGGAGVTALDTASLDAIAKAAMNRWTLILGGVPAQFYGMEFTVADLGGLALARIEGNTVSVDETAAGHGWFIDPTPYDDGEFKVRTADGLRATPSSEAHGKMDLLTVLMHELGHAIGFPHDASVPGATALMAEDLVPGLRAVDFAPPGQASQAPAMWTWDADKGAFVQDAGVWQNGRLFSYLSLATMKQAAADDSLAGTATGEAEAGEDWLEFAPAASEEGGEVSLIEWVGL